jgi:TonB family protein
MTLAKGSSPFMAQLPNNTPFSLLPQRRPPWKEFMLSMSTEGVVIVLLAWVGVLHPEVLVPPKHDYHAIELVPTPVPVNHQPAPLRIIKPAHTALPEIEPEPQPVEALRLPPPQVRHKAVQDDPPAAPKVDLAMKAPAVPPLAPVVPRKLVKMDNFSTGSSATPTIARAPQKTQTGGFGDPNGIPARANNGRPVTIAQLGSFDLPPGPGYGNGTGGAKGARGVVASAGFGNGTATGDGSGNVNTTRGTVRQAGFGDAEAVAATPIRPKTDSAAPKLVPAEIVLKPTPIYTEEAKKLRIEGEVLLEVVFESSGRLRVLRVMRGLGHGLDEAATRAAEQIRFKPALRDGQPADSTAVLHIVFQLA